MDRGRRIFGGVLVGRGPDGHPALVFPGKPALAEKQRWAIEVPEPGLNPHVPRVTLTYPALASAGSVAFVAAGAGKTAMMERVSAGGAGLPAGPRTSVRALVWLRANADAAAACTAPATK